MTDDNPWACPKCGHDLSWPCPACGRDDCYLHDPSTMPEWIQRQPCGWGDECCGGDPRGCWQPGQEEQREHFEAMMRNAR
jgi:hypothetical protein